MAEPAPGNPAIVRITAPNPGPMTLSGTNTYVVADPEGGAWVVDPGPPIESHLEAVRAAADERGGARGILLTHGHADHSESAAELAESLDVEVVLGTASTTDESTPTPTRRVRGGEVTRNPKSSASAPATIGPMDVLPTPGHAADHVALLVGRACLCGDLILGEGSSIVPPRSGGGSLADYMRSLDELAARDADLLCPGHGPWITDPAAKIAAYREHRLEREAKLLAALEAGRRETDELLDAAWDDVPELLRPAAAIALDAHMEKLAEEGRLPTDQT